MDSVKEEKDFENTTSILNNSKVLYVNLRCNDDMKLKFLCEWIKTSKLQMDQFGAINITCIETVKKIFEFMSKYSLVDLHLNMDSSIIGSQLTECIKSFEASIKPTQQMTIEDRQLTSQKLETYLLIFQKCHISKLNLEKCHLNQETASLLENIFQSHGIQLSRLTIWDGAMHPDIYGAMATIIKITGCKEVRFIQCCLTEEKLRIFNKECKKNKIQLNELSVVDGVMPPEGYHALAEFIGMSGIEKVYFGQCDLSKHKLERFSEACEGKKIVIPELNICDRVMPAEAYGDLAAIISDCGCSSVAFGQCDLSAQKLEYFSTACEERNAVIMFLTIQESHSVASVGEISALCKLITTNVKSLVLHDWDIDANGMQRLKETFQRDTEERKFLQLPDESIHQSRALEMQPGGIELHLLRELIFLSNSPK